MQMNNTRDKKDFLKQNKQIYKNTKTDNKFKTNNQQQCQESNSLLFLLYTPQQVMTCNFRTGCNFAKIQRSKKTVNAISSNGAETMEF